MAVKDTREGYNEYMRLYMRRRYTRRRRMAIEYLGGRCVRCGATDSLELDHKDPATKAFTIAKLWNVPMPKFWEEVKKCQILCDEHHNDKTLAENGRRRARGTHGTLAAVRYCKPRCKACREVANKYNRERKKQLRESSLRGRAPSL